MGFHLCPCKGKGNNQKCNAWLAGVIDGDGHFDFRKHILKSIRVKVHIRDIEILTYIQNNVNGGRIRYDRAKPHVLFIVSTRAEMTDFVTRINGFIKIKVPSFQRACVALGLTYITPNMNLKPFDPYFAGLVDSDRSVVFNFPGNRIEVNVEISSSPNVDMLIMDHVIPGTKPNIVRRKTASGKISKAFKFQSVSGMIHVYNYFMINQLHCTMKYYRVCKIKRFLELRHYKQNLGKKTFKIYSAFLLECFS